MTRLHAFSSGEGILEQPKREANMCDEDTLEDDRKHQQQTNLSRRQFNTLAAGAALMMVLPQVANALDVTETDVEIKTQDGMADCLFVHPSSGEYPGVIIWPDILGLRPSFRLMAKRLAESGYSVLVVNPYYRSAKAPVVSPGDTFQNDSVRSRVLPFARKLSAATVVTDATAFVAFLDAQKAVDKNRKIGTTGYCMGGPFTMHTAAAFPDRIGAGASFHGARLVTDKDDSPHLLIPKMRAEYLFAIAANDDERQPDAKNILRKTCDEAGMKAEIEVYKDAMHGWCPPDSQAYHQEQAEHAWARLLALFKSALA